MNRLQRLKNEMVQRQWDNIIVSSIPLIRYLTGYCPDLETGHNPFEPGPILLKVERSGDELRGCMLLPEDYVDAVSAPWIACIPYVMYDVQTLGYDRRNHYRDALRKVLSPGLQKVKIGCEMNGVPAAAVEWLNGNVTIEDCGPVFDRLRLIKDEDELQQIRSAVQLANVGQNAVRKYAREDVSELELFGIVKTEMEKAAGQRIALLADFISGTRTSEIGGAPTGRIIRSGELVLTDLVPHLNGYWGDSCSVTRIGPVTAKMKAVHEDVQQALEIAKQSIRPGAKVQDIDQAVRQFLLKKNYSYPHHTGHGLGLQYHEGPLVSRNGDAVLEENMVIALEPGVYLPDEGFGIRLEDVFHVTKDGFEQWTQYPKNLD